MDQVFSNSIYEMKKTKKQKKGAVTYSTDQEKELSKMFIITLGNSIELESP